MRLMIATDGKATQGQHAVWSLLDKMKPDFLIVRNQPGVDMIAYNWAKAHHVLNVRAPLSAMPKHLMDQKPDAILNFGEGSDRKLREFLYVAKRAQVPVIPVAY